MRVMEATQVYRARLGGGSAPNTLASDLKRGAFGYTALAAGYHTTASLGRSATP
jgi:soluble lytic murein transglycosylase